MGLARKRGRTQFAFAQWLYVNPKLPLSMKLAARAIRLVMPIGLGGRKARRAALRLAIVDRDACMRMAMLRLVRRGMLAARMTALGRMPAFTFVR